MNIGNCLHTIRRVWSKRSPESWLDYLRAEGMRIGTGTKLFSKPSAVSVSYTHLDVYKRQIMWRVTAGDTSDLNYIMQIM